MRGHYEKRRCSGRRHQDHRALPRRPAGVTLEVNAEARGAGEIPDGVTRAFRVGEVEKARHGLKTEGVIVHVQRCEGNGVRALFRIPLGGRMDGVQHL